MGKTWVIYTGNCPTWLLNTASRTYRGCLINNASWDVRCLGHRMYWRIRITWKPYVRYYTWRTEDGMYVETALYRMLRPMQLFRLFMLWLISAEYYQENEYDGDREDSERGSRQVGMRSVRMLISHIDETRH